MKEDIIKLVVDKLLIGLILVGVGFYVSSNLDKMKSDNELTKELAKIQAEKIGETWADIYLLEEKAGQFYTYVFGTDTTFMKKIEQTIEQGEFEQEAIKVFDKINRNRFWLGEENHDEAKRYVSLLIRLVAAYVDGRETESIDFEVELDNSWKNIEQIRQQLLSEK